MRNFQKQILLLLMLLFFAIGGCVKKAEEQPPTNRDGVSDGSQDRADTPSEERPPDRPPAAPKGEVGRNEYTIQVGIFDRPEAADQLAYELRAKNVNNFTQKAGKRWRVCVGRYYSQDRADRRLRQLIDMGFDKAVVIAPEQ
ncbi:SPOR domain-containing protein [candidate division KSB1 bacterium]|nr:SPOR domain-containing protein [candidate division KSB1 bacterium]